MRNFYNICYYGMSSTTIYALLKYEVFCFSALIYPLAMQQVLSPSALSLVTQSICRKPVIVIQNQLFNRIFISIHCFT